MIVSNVLGGLGNQMFQYAIAHALAEKHKADFYLDISGFEAYPLRRFELDTVFGINNVASKDQVNSLRNRPVSLFRRALAKLSGQKTGPCYQEPGFPYDEIVMQRPLPIYVDGYWQSERYFIEAQDSLRACFSFKSPLSNNNKRYADKILACESVSLHIRRGDYLTDAKTNSVHGLLPLDYYSRAVSHILAKSSQSHFFVFSDDIQWAKENLSFIANVTFIDNIDNAPDWQEMCLMSYCNNNIIANSSFSWWGAWLNANKGKTVVAPVKWFNDESIDVRDLIPQAWTRL